MGINSRSAGIGHTICLADVWPRRFPAAPAAPSASASPYAAVFLWLSFARLIPPETHWRTVSRALSPAWCVQTPASYIILPMPIPTHARTAHAGIRGGSSVRSVQRETESRKPKYGLRRRISRRQGRRSDTIGHRRTVEVRRDVNALLGSLIS